jgi:hypothetical protein
MDAEGNLDPSPATAMYGGVYSFLPLGESNSGVKFPIQADFLVQPGREAVNEEAAWNQWLNGLDVLHGRLHPQSAVGQQKGQ